MTSFVACDLVTGEQLADIPFRTFTTNKVLGGPGSWSGTIEHDHPAISGVNARRLAPNRRALFVIDEHPNVPPLFGGIVRNPAADLADAGNEDLTIGGDGLWGWLRGDGSTTGRFWTSVDHTYHLSRVVPTISALWTVAAAGGAIALRLATSGLGPVHPDLVMKLADAPNFGTTIEQLCTDYIVQFDTDYGWDTTDPHQWRPYGIQRFDYPRRGRDLNLTLEHGVNCDAVSWSADGFQQADQVIGFGAGTLRSVRTASALLGTYPLLQELLQRKDITTQARLDDATAAALAARQVPMRIAKIVVKQDARDITPTTMNTGDTVFLDLDAGYIQEHGERWRVDSVQVDYDAERQPTITTNLSIGTINPVSGTVVVPAAVPQPKHKVLWVMRYHSNHIAQLNRLV